MEKKKKYSMFVKCGKVLSIVIASIILFVGLVSILISTVGRTYVNDNASILVGRNMHIEGMQVNLFTGKVGIDTLVLYEADAKTPFVKFQRFETNLSVVKLLTGKVNVDYLLFDRLYVNVTQSDTIFNFSDMLDFFAADAETDETEVADTTAGVPLVINNIKITNSFIHYQDLMVGSDFKLEDFSLNIPGIDLSNLEAALGIRLDFVGGGSLNTSVLYKNTEQTYEVSIDLRNFRLNSITPYVQQSMNIGSLGGMLDADVHITGELEHVLNCNIKGDVHLYAFDLQDRENHSFFSMDSVFVGIDKINLWENAIALSGLHIFAPSFDYVVGKDSVDNITRLMLPTEEPTAVGDSASADSVESPLHFTADNFEITQATVHYVDHSLRVTPFIYNISQLNVKSPRIDLDASNKIMIDALLEKTGKLKVMYEGNFADISKLDLKVMLNNVALSSFSPYSTSMFAYPLTSGTLTINSQTKILNNQLKGTNDVVIYKPTVDKKLSDIKPEMNVPLKLGLYILTDKDGKCAMNLPVSGNVDSPEFSYKKVLLKVLSNLIVKVATSPFDFGSKGESGNSISLAGAMVPISPEGYDKLDHLANELNEKPELVMTFVQNLNYQMALEEISTICLKHEYYLSLHPEKAGTHLDMFDMNDLESIRLDDASLMTLADTLVARKGLVPNGSKIKDKAIVLYQADAENFINKIMGMRNQTVLNYLTIQKGIEARRVKVQSATIDEMKANTGQSSIFVSMDME